MKLLLITWLLLMPGLCAGQVFKCTDSTGAITYTNIGCKTPNGKAIKVEGEDKKGLENNLKSWQINARSVLTLVKAQLSGYFYYIVFAIYFLMSIRCFLVYQEDKRYARIDLCRIPENTLHCYELLGGWPGGLIAQRVLRHKNRKLSYQVVFWLIVAVHVVGWFDYIALDQALLKQGFDFVSSVV